MTAVIYARYSSDNQREESIEGQIRECTAFAEKNGNTTLCHYIDRAFSSIGGFYLVISAAEPIFYCYFVVNSFP